MNPLQLRVWGYRFRIKDQQDWSRPSWHYDETLLQSYEASRSICHQNQTIILLIIYRN